MTHSGVDFKGVRTVINYQPPPSVASYTHRVGRTGRAGHAGIAVTLLSPIDDAVRTQLDAHLVSTGAAGVTANSSAHPGLQPLPRLTAASIESLRYRAEDVARSITKLAIKEARARDLRQQLLNSQRLTEHFASNPGEMQLLQHAAPLRGSQAPGHLKHIPGYLRDSAAPGHPGGGARHRGTGAGSCSRRERLYHDLLLHGTCGIYFWCVVAVGHMNILTRDDVAQKAAKAGGWAGPGEGVCAGAQARIRR